ncbi:MAG: ABC transporter ATP-binding protein [Actinobacteria bacterium]|nr:MAG: ABC transporter ATP-binding protein [Actinomycetota bacterium]
MSTAHAKHQTGEDYTAVLENVSKVYKMGEVEISALKNVNLKIRKGEFIAVLGPSGSGKTTLLNLLGGIDIPSNGTIKIDGLETTNFSQRQLTLLRRQKIGFIFQFFNLIPTLTAKENVEYALELATRRQLPAGTDAVSLLDEVGLKGRLNHFPYQLSGGEQQRVAVARAVAKNPALILGDEPTGNLDFRTGKLVLQTMKELHEHQGKTVIIVTHNTPIAKVADRILYLHDGEIAKEEVQERPTPVEEVAW